MSLSGKTWGYIMNITQQNFPLPLDKDLFGLGALVPAINRPHKADPEMQTELEREISFQIIDLSDEETFDELARINLDDREDGESAEKFIAKRMFARLIADLSFEANELPKDLFGQIEVNREYEKQDALIWLYALNPDGSDMPFDWVCTELGFDTAMVRRIVARNVRADLKRVLKLLSSMISYQHAKKCEVELREFVDLKGWNYN